MLQLARLKRVIVVTKIIASIILLAVPGYIKFYLNFEINAHNKAIKLSKVHISTFNIMA